MPHIAVILSGCGVYDGAEIHESVCTMLALEQTGATYRCLAPDIEQMHVIDHLSGDSMSGVRNVLVESARIARGAIDDITEADIDAYDAVIMPGGFGAAKNLSTFAIAGASCTVDGAVAAFLRAAKDAGKPIGALCIAPAVLAAVFGDGIRLTVGTARDFAEKIDATGAQHVDCPVDDIVIDEKNRIVTSPCYMLASSVSEVMHGATKTVQAVVQMARSRTAR
jgi:enhancing lycopene biosynthesis protein 2